jgi:RNA polymerase sigma-70 factor, ECF subfamily
VTVNAIEWQTEEFERHRPHLRAVAYRMLGSLSDADDVVQEAWLRLSRSDAEAVENMRSWLTTVVARLSLDELRARRSRGEEPLAGGLPDLLIDGVNGIDPEHQALLADSVGLALLVVLFAFPFDEIAPIVDRTPEATRQLASRARRRVRPERTVPDVDLETQREVVEAFLGAARDGDFDRLVAVLDPDVVVRADFGSGRWQEVRGAEAVARQALSYARAGVGDARPAIVNGAAGVVGFLHGEPFSIAAVTVRNGKIVELDFFNDPERLRLLDMTILDE